MASDMMKLIEILKEMDIRYDTGNGYLVIDRNSLIERFPSDKEPEDRGGSYYLARMELNKRLGARIIWGKLDDDWFGVDRIIPDTS